MEKICPICKKVFEASYKNRTYCNLECRKQAHREYYRNYMKQYSKIQWKTNPNFRKRMKANWSKYCNKLKLEVFSHYSNGTPKCACCGETHIEFLTIDHINNDGAKQRDILKITAGIPFYLWLKRNKYPNEFQVLCWNCNCAKGFFGYCPHIKQITI